MSPASVTDLSNVAYGSLQPVLDLQATILEGLLQAQQAQLQMMSVWQQPFAAVNRELWDQWIVRFGGGVPLDG